MDCRESGGWGRNSRQWRVAGGGWRKVRWTRPGIGKRGGVRVIYFTRLAKGEIWLLVIYAKSVRGSIPASILKAIREAIAHGG